MGGPMAVSDTVNDITDEQMVSRLAGRLTPRWSPFIPHKPTERQMAFLLLPHLEAMYGGAAGGGKSDCILMAATQYVDIPGYAALLLRRTFSDLAKPGALMDRAHNWFGGTAAHWDERSKTWTFPSGARISFGYLEHERDKYNYQSAEYQFIGFDELTQFQETMYRYMFSRLRRPDDAAGTALAQVPLRMRAASNPGGIGHEWVRQRFIIEGLKAGRIFCPAKLTDNPYVDQKSYTEALLRLDPLTMHQLLDGNWEVMPTGDFFKREWWGIVDQAPIDHLNRFGIRGNTLRFWDLAATTATSAKYTVGALISVIDGVWYLRDIRRFRGDPFEVEMGIRSTAEQDGLAVRVAIEQEPGSGGVITIDHYQRTVLRGFNVIAYKPTAPKLSRAGPVSSAAKAGNFKLVRGDWIGTFLDETSAYPEGNYMDQVDAVSGAVALLSKPTVSPRVRKL